MIFFAYGFVTGKKKKSQDRREKRSNRRCADDLLQDDFNLRMSLMHVPSTGDCRSVVCNFPEFCFRWVRLEVSVACERAFMRLGSQVASK